MKSIKRLFFFFAFACVVSSLCAAESPRLNIVYILADDMGWKDLGCYGSSFYKTPNIDQLAARGMKFTDAYAACNVCSPTRASIMTGKYPARLHLTDWIPGQPNKPTRKLLHPDFLQHLPLEEITIAEALKAAGYATGAMGKWHLGGKGFQPEQQGFDEYVAGNMKGGDPGHKEPGKGEYDLTTAAEKFIDDHKEKPFFLYLPYYSVHIPLAAKKELVEKYKKLIDPSLPQTNAIYAAMVESLDTCVGRVVRKLEELKLTENTVIIFNSDNGGLHVHEGRSTPATSNAPLRDGKGYLHEGGHREPLIVVWPGVTKPASVCSVPVCSIDYFPTLLDMANVPMDVAHPVDGVSLTALFKGGQKPVHDAIYWHYPHYSDQGGLPGGAIRVGDFKFIEYYEDGRWELFNLKNDIAEEHDLSETMSAKAAELEAKLDYWRRDVQAQMMLPNPDYTGK